MELCIFVLARKENTKYKKRGKKKETKRKKERKKGRKGKEISFSQRTVVKVRHSSNLMEVTNSRKSFAN